MSKAKHRGPSSKRGGRNQEAIHMDRITTALAEIVIVGGFGGTLAICLVAVFGVM